MHISLFEIFLNDEAQGFSLGYVASGNTQSALLGVTRAKYVDPEKMEYGYMISIDVLYYSLIVSTIRNFIDGLKKDKDEDDNTANETRD